MDEPLPIIAAVIGLLGLLGTAWWRIQISIDKVRTEAFAAITDRDNRISAMAAQNGLLLSQVSEFREKVAETYVSKAGFREASDQLLREMKNGFDHVGERMDWLAEALRASNAWAAAAAAREDATRPTR